MAVNRDNVPQLGTGFDVFERASEYQTQLLLRLDRARKALEDAGVSYAVIGGNAVAAWVGSVDQSALRATQDVDMMLAPDDFARARIALEGAGFRYRRILGIEMFLDGPHGRAREGIHILFAGQMVRPEYLAPAPDLSEVVQSQRGYIVLALEALVRMKLTSYRLKDRVHLQDLLGVGLLDESWMEKVPPVLRARMREVLDNPDA
jgi:hypothetical protein